MYLPRYSSSLARVRRNRVERYFSFFPRGRYFPVLQRRTCPTSPPPPGAREAILFIDGSARIFIYGGRRPRPLGTSAGHYLRTIDRARARAHGIWKNARSRVLPFLGQEPLRGEGGARRENGNSFTSAGFIFSFAPLRVEHATRILLIIIIIIIATAVRGTVVAAAVVNYARVNGIQFPSL